jgi:adenosyl cobinamide kinase/adenosyl cobinamide phosphate guanylyltransferase
MARQPDTTVTLILGGARSGKSRHGEALIGALPPPWTYLATAEAWDAEMAARIAAHRARRDGRWQTVEAPLALPNRLREAAAAPVLVDCLTLWLTNLMLGGHEVPAATEALLDALAARPAPTVLVANEVGLGIVPEHRLGRDFRDAAGVLHQRLATQADRVLFMVAGLPMVVK